ncbi:hypothetical protein [Caballeronia sp. LZ032]|uniref:hypothetical protein n=1 Tax=Caballeronia sp. LZ032 TaxID=3038565 RepID=UPI00286157AD|nr:hypothetical protein [Caballeronia sp. LZ032]MDR5881084.1 hypothetical protein [Caballeronia sp. LZ032]
MATPNEQSLVAGKLIIVALVPGKGEATISVGKSRPAKVRIQSFLDAGLDEREALKRVMEIASIAVQAAAT